MNEERLHELARKLGAQAVERLDVEATARHVVERLREPAPRVRWIRQTWLRLAAAVLLVVGGAGIVTRIARDNGDNAHVAHLVIDDLSDLSTDELRDVLTSLDTLLEEAAVSDSAADLHELDPQQLRAMLRSLEG